MQRTLLLHSLRLDISADEPDLWAWVERLYGANDLSAPFPEQRARLRLLIERLDAPGVAALAIPAQAIFAENNLCGAPCYYHNGRFYARRDDALRHVIAYDLNTATITAQLGGDFWRSGQNIIVELIRPILQSFILPFYGVKTLHGALLSRAGRAVLLAGPGGVGKSTTALSLAQSGWDVLSDDGPFFMASAGLAYGLSSLDFAHLSAQTLDLFPHLRPLVVGERDSRGKYALNLRYLQPGGEVGPVALTHFVTLRRRPCARPSLIRLDRAQLYRDLVYANMVIFRAAPFQAGGYPFREYSQATLDLLRLLAQGAQAYELEFADEHLSWLPDLLEQL